MEAIIFTIFLRRRQKPQGAFSRGSPACNGATAPPVLCLWQGWFKMLMLWVLQLEKQQGPGVQKLFSAVQPLGWTHPLHALPEVPPRQQAWSNSQLPTPGCNWNFTWEKSKATARTTPTEPREPWLQRQTNLDLQEASGVPGASTFFGP
jgi:hypothetical protein